MEFPVFLLRTVPVTCTVRSSEEQGAPRSTLRQPQWLVDICLCLTVLNILTGRCPQWRIFTASSVTSTFFAYSRRKLWRSLVSKVILASSWEMGKRCLRCGPCWSILKYGVCVPNPDLFLTQGLQLCRKACFCGGRRIRAFTPRESASAGPIVSGPLYKGGLQIPLPTSIQGPASFLVGAWGHKVPKLPLHRALRECILRSEFT